MKAAFCVATGVPPSEYDALSLTERQSFLQAVIRQQRG
jgi:hypothetical protein